MGRRGPPPKPTALRLIQGNPGRLPVNRHEPKPRAAHHVECPKWLEPEAKKVWERVVPELELLNLLTVVDVDVLAGFCQACARWQQAEKLLTKHGLTFRTVNGYIQQRPEISAAVKYLQLVRTLGAELGLTPAARSRIQTPGELAGETADEKRILG